MRKLLLFCLPMVLGGCVVESGVPYYVYDDAKPRVVVTDNRIHRHATPPVIVKRPRVIVRKPSVVVTENRIHKRLGNRIKQVIQGPKVANRIGSRKPHVTVSSNRIKRRTDSQTVIKVPENTQVRIS